MRTNRIVLAGVAGATLVAGAAVPAAAHGDHSDQRGTFTSFTLVQAQQRLAQDTAREESALQQAIAKANASTVLTAAEKSALSSQLTTALKAVQAAAATGASATTVDAVAAAGKQAATAFGQALKTAGYEGGLVAASQHESSEVAALQAKLQALVAQYVAHGVPASASATAASSALQTAAADATAARAAAVSDPATAAKDLAAARAAGKTAVADIAQAAHDLAAALQAQQTPTSPTTPTTPVSTDPGTTAPTSTNPCDGRHDGTDRVSFGGDRRDGAYGTHDRDGRSSGTSHSGSSRSVAFHH